MYKVYGIIECNYCKNATALLQSKGMSYSYISLDNDEETLSSIKAEYNWRTVPLILKHSSDCDEFIGGYDNLREHLKKLEEVNGCEGTV